MPCDFLHAADGMLSSRALPCNNQSSQESSPTARRRDLVDLRGRRPRLPGYPPHFPLAPLHLSPYYSCMQPDWQLTLDQLPARVWDVAIVGAGPAGSTAASLLASRGHGVLLLERHHFPRDKVCGDVLLPDAIEMLSHIGVLDRVKQAAHSLDRMRIYSPGRFTFDIDAAYLTLPRKRLDALLAHHAYETGATVCTAAVANVIQERDHVLLNLANGETIRAKYSLLATGSQVDTAHHLNLVTDPHPNALAMRCYLESDYDIPHGILSYDRALRPGYAWIFPLGDNRYNVGCGMLIEGRPNVSRTLKEMFATFCDAFPPMRQLLAQGRLVSHLTGAGIRTSFGDSEHIARGNVCAIGETVGTTLPFSGEGIGTAMRFAQIAADQLDILLLGGHSPLERIVPLMRDHFTSLFAGYRRTERWLAYPWINDLIARRVNKSRFLQDACRGIILGTVNPNEVYSVKGIVKAFMR